jgi:anti-sigma factor RsiW
LINPQQPTNVGACSWIRSVDWWLDLPRQWRISRFVVRVRVMRRGFSFPRGVPLPAADSAALLERVFSHSSSARGVRSLRRLAPVQEAATTFPSRSIPHAVHTYFRSTIFVEPIRH